MNRSRKTFVACASGLLLAVVACAGGDATSRASAGAPVVVLDAWARPADQGANTAVYLTVENRGSTPDSLTGVSTDEAESAGLHASVQRDGMMHMEAMAALPIPAGDRLVLAPLGRHVMVLRLRRPLAVGDSLSLALSLASGGRLPVMAVVRAP